MLTTIRKYVRAFFTALRYTLRGEKPPLLRVRDQYPQLAAWWTQTSALVDAVERAADANGIDAAARKILMIHVDKRDISAATILASIRYHAEREYPYMLAQSGNFNSLTLQATNLNDQYLALRLGENMPERVKPAVNALAVHLQQLPSI